MKMNNIGQAIGGIGHVSGYTTQVKYAAEMAAVQRPIPSAIDNIAVSVSVLSDVADQLAARLERVLLIPPPAAVGDSCKDMRGMPATCPMAQEIDGHRQRIERITASLQDVLNRLEV
jgi:hypothetical protein